MCDFCGLNDGFFCEAVSWAFEVSLVNSVNSTNGNFNFCPVCGEKMTLVKTHFQTSTVSELSNCDFCLCGTDENVNYFEAEMRSKDKCFTKANSDCSPSYGKDGNKQLCEKFNYCPQCGRKITGGKPNANK